MSIARWTTEKADREEHDTEFEAPGHDSLESQVAAHPFFIGMSERHLRLLADCAMKIRFQQGRLFFERAMRQIGLTLSSKAKWRSILPSVRPSQS